MVVPEERPYCYLIKRLCFLTPGIEFTEGSCSPHRRGAPRRPRWDAIASLTANQNLYNRRCWQHHRRPPRILLALPSSLRIGEDHLKPRSCPPQTGQMPDQGFPSRPLTPSSPPVRPTRLVTYCTHVVLATAQRFNNANVKDGFELCKFVMFILNVY